MLVQAGGIVAPTGAPGSVLMFHGNLVHGSAPNITPYPRRIVYLTLCAISNLIRRPTRPEWIAHRDFTPIEPVSDDALLNYACRYSKKAAAEYEATPITLFSNAPSPGGIETEMREHPMPKLGQMRIATMARVRPCVHDLGFDVRGALAQHDDPARMDRASRLRADRAGRGRRPPRLRAGPRAAGSRRVVP